MEGLTNAKPIIEAKEKTPTELVFRYGVKTEVMRVIDVYRRKNHFIEKKFKPSLPVGLPPLSSDEIPDEERVTQAVGAEYHEDVYLSFAEQLKREWEEVGNPFMGKLRELNGNVPSSVKISLTTYGMGGSYWIPDQVFMNVAWARGEEDKMRLLMHEISHLPIEEAVQVHDISHWHKELAVELIMERCAPGRVGRLPHVISEIEKENPGSSDVLIASFHTFYPNVSGFLETLKQPVII